MISSKPAAPATSSSPSTTSAKKALCRSDTITPSTVDVRLASDRAIACGE
jgi:hypothetical protein